MGLTRKSTRRCFSNFLLQALYRVAITLIRHSFRSYVSLPRVRSIDRVLFLEVSSRKPLKTDLPRKQKNQQIKSVSFRSETKLTDSIKSFIYFQRKSIVYLGRQTESVIPTNLHCLTHIYHMYYLTMIYIIKDAFSQILDYYSM